MPRGEVNSIIIAFRLDSISTTSERDNELRPKRGDVMDVRRPGDTITNNERNQGNLVIIESDLSYGAAHLLMQPEMQRFGQSMPTNVVRFRQEKLDLDALTALILPEEKALDVWPYRDAFWHGSKDVQAQRSLKEKLGGRILNI